MSYHSISLDDQYDGVVNLPHHVDFYIRPIHSWIEAICAITYQFGTKFDDVIRAHDFSYNPPIVDHHVGFHFLNNIVLLWMITKDKKTFLY